MINIMDCIYSCYWNQSSKLKYDMYCLSVCMYVHVYMYLPVPLYIPFTWKNYSTGHPLADISGVPGSMVDNSLLYGTKICGRTD